LNKKLMGLKRKLFKTNSQLPHSVIEELQKYSKLTKNEKFPNKNS